MTTITIEAKGFEHKLELLGNFDDSIPEVKAAIVREAFGVNEKVVPKGATGGLRESFYFEVPDILSLVFGWKAAYARFVNDGAPPSEGRYVPGMPCAGGVGKRLTMKPEQVVATDRKKVAGLLHRGFEFESSNDIIGSLNRGNWSSKLPGTAVMKRERHQISPRTQMYREAISRGLPESVARVAKTVPIEAVSDRYTQRDNLSGQPFGEYTPEYSKAYRAKIAAIEDEQYRVADIIEQPGMDIYYDKLEDKKQQIARTFGRKPAARNIGSIKVAVKQPSAFVRRVKRHEIGHALDWASGMLFSGYQEETDETIEDYTSMHEEESARMWEMAGGLHHGDIGMHPGQKGQHYSKAFLEAMRIIAINETVKALHEVVVA